MSDELNKNLLDKLPDTSSDETNPEPKPSRIARIISKLVPLLTISSAIINAILSTSNPKLGYTVALALSTFSLMLDFNRYLKKECKQ